MIVEALKCTLSFGFTATLTLFIYNNVRCPFEPWIIECENTPAGSVQTLVVFFKIVTIFFS